MRVALSSIILVAMGASGATAICPSPTPKLCARFFESDTVFLATVVGREYAEETEPDDTNWVRYEVRVEQVFRGKPDELVSFLTENSSARWSAEVGETYLVFLTDGQASATCGPLDESTNSEAAVRGIRTLAGAGYSTIEGEVVTGGGGRDATKAGAGLRLTVSGPDGFHESITDENGQFRFELRPGHYRLIAGKLRPTVYSKQNLDKIDLDLGQCAQFQLSGDSPK